MKVQKNSLQPEDYLEPRCVLCDEPYGAKIPVKPIPQQRVLQKMDEYMSRRDYAGAERHLLYWLEEARLGHDLRGELLVRNEMVGHYRKTGEKEKAMDSAGEALRLLDEMDFGGTISAGTTYINIATACNAFGENERSMELFRKAREVYEEQPLTSPQLLGGLYNNMALTAASLSRYEEANALYDQAMAAMEKVPGGELEQAITCLNRADLLRVWVGAEEAEERIFSLLDQAYELLKNSASLHDGYYAFVCEKCAPSFEYYGYFAAASELTGEAEKIYERNGAGESVF